MFTYPKPTLLPLSALLLAACSEAPDSCRHFGVAVQDGDRITGTIVEEHVVSEGEVRARCQSPFEPRRGCVLTVGPGEYVIYASDRDSLEHERCHALYEEWEHS